MLNEDDFKDEFSHTILHNQNVFDEFKAIQAKKKAEEEQKEKAAVDEEAKKAAEAMEKMKLDKYQPKFGQEKEMFNGMYMQFAEQLNNAGSDKDIAVTDRPYSQQSSISTTDEVDQDDGEDQPQESAPTEKAVAKKRMSGPGVTEQQTMINISSCEFAEFEKYMTSQYGEKQFKDGYELIRQNRNIIYQDGGEEMLCEMLAPLGFADLDQLKGFINFCTTYLIVQNMEI